CDRDVDAFAGLCAGPDQHGPHADVLSASCFGTWPGRSRRGHDHSHLETADAGAVHIGAGLVIAADQRTFTDSQVWLLLGLGNAGDAAGHVPALALRAATVAAQLSQAAHRRSVRL